MTDPEIMWDWVKAYGVPLYGTFWFIRGMKEYQFIYHKTIRQELADILMCAGVAPDGEEALEVTKAWLQGFSVCCLKLWQKNMGCRFQFHPRMNLHPEHRGGQNKSKFLLIIGRY